MKPKNIAGVVCYVKDLKSTKKFYETLGFTVKLHSPGAAQAHLSGFWINFLAQGRETKAEFKREAKLKDKGAGLYLYIGVENVDKYFEMLCKKKLKPSSAPRNWPWGNREFALRDPDGYKLIFFKKL